MADTLPPDLRESAQAAHIALTCISTHPTLDMSDYLRGRVDAAAAGLEAALAAVPAQPGIRTLSSEQIERHTLTASECPPDSAVMLVSSINRLLGKSRGEGIRFAQPVAWMMTPNKQSHRLLMPSVQFEKPVVRADWELTPLYAAPQAVPVPEWQPIETAPKDRDVLVACSHGLYVARYCEHDIEWWHVDDNKHGPFPLRGSSPTHWQPLPAAPKDQPHE